MWEPESESLKISVFASLFISAIVGRYLKETETIQPRYFFAEILVSIALCGVCYAVGLMQSWNFAELVVYGVGSALGQIQIFKFIAQQFAKR
ncbi:membrane hypothetical protein [Vibrio chagasii]|nr:membrane hypothetical protein [Vibrio chagasii]